MIFVINRDLHWYQMDYLIQFSLVNMKIVIQYLSGIQSLVKFHHNR